MPIPFIVYQLACTAIKGYLEGDSIWNRDPLQATNEWFRGLRPEERDVVQGQGGKIPSSEGASTSEALILLQAKVDELEKQMAEMRKRMAKL